MIQTICKNRAKIIGATEEKWSRIKQFRKHELSDVGEALLKSFRQEKSDNVPVSGPFPWSLLFFLNLSVS